MHPVVVFPLLPKISESYQAFRDAALKFCRDYTDDVYFVQHDNFQEILNDVRAFNPIAVIAGSEVGVPSADWVGEALGLSSNPSATSLNRRDKFLMAQALEEAGVEGIHTTKVKTIQECEAILDRWNTYPVVLKPLAGAATQGVHFCLDKADALEKFQKIREGLDLFGADANEGVLVQEFVRGTEYIVNTVSHNGRHVITDVWEYSKIPIGSMGNAYNCAKLVREPEERHLQLMDYAVKVLSALDFRYGPSHTEIMFTSRGPLLIETGARPMGGYFPMAILKSALDHQIVDVALDSYICEEHFNALYFKPYSPKRSVMLKLFIAPNAVKVGSMPLLALRKYISTTEPSETMARFGQVLPQTVDLVTASAELIMTADTEAELMRDYGLLRELELLDFNLIFSEEPVAVEPMRFSLNGAMIETPEGVNTWERLIDWLGLLTRCQSPGTELVLLSSPSPSEKALEILLRLIGWEGSGSHFAKC